MDGVGVLQDIGQRQRCARSSACASLSPTPMPGVSQPTAPLPARLVDHLWHAAHQRLQRPVLRAGDVPEVEGEQVCLREYACGQFSRGKVVGDIMQDLVDAGDIDGSAGLLRA